jgi:hypothetical protein
MLIGAGISAGIMFFVRSKLKSVRFERTACNYTRSGSFKTTTRHDNFLFNTITKIPLPKNNSNRR